MKRARWALVRSLAALAAGWVLAGIEPAPLPRKAAAGDAPPPWDAPQGQPDQAAAGERFARLRPACAAGLCAERLRHHPADGAAAACRLRALLAQDAWREAVREGSAIEKRVGASPVIEGLLGEAAFRAGRLREASERLGPLAQEPAVASRSLVALGLLRVAEGRDGEGAGLIERALEADPEDPIVLFRAAGAASTRAVAVERLERYLARSAGDEPDRVVAARGSLAFQRALGERRTWVPVERPERASLHLERLAGPRSGLRGFTIEASLGDEKPVRLLLDTGSTGLFLVERIARRHGIQFLAEDTAFAGGGRQRHRVRRGILPSLALGKLRFKDALVLTSRSEIEPEGKYHGVIGLAPFDGYRLTLDLASDRLILDTERSSQGAPYWEVAGQFLVEADGGAAGLFVVDTGAVRSVVSSAFAEQQEAARLGGPVRIEGFGGALPEARSLRGIRLAFEGLRTPSDRLVAADFTLRSRLGGVEIAGFLGLDLLADSRLVIDTVSRRITAMPPRR